MKKFFAVLAGLVFLAVVIGTGVFLYKKSKVKPVIYQTAQASFADIIKKTVATGSVVPRKEVEIKPLVSGIIDELYIEEGQVVVEGAPLAKVRVIPDMGQLSNAESRVNKAEINLVNAERDYERQKNLVEEGTVARADLDRAETAAKNAREELVAARDAFDIVRTGTSARVAKASTTLIKSTTSGTVLEVPVEVGNSVIQANNFNEGTTVASVADMSDMIFEGKVDESEVGRIRPGMELLLTVGALPDHRIRATLEHIAPKGIEENGAIQFEIRAAVVPEEGIFLRANYSANADIVLDKREGVLSVDEGLLQFEGEQAYVEVETGPQQFERRDVVTGLSDGLQIEVLSGISEEDKIKQPNPDLVAEGPAGGGRGRRRAGL